MQSQDEGDTPRPFYLFSYIIVLGAKFGKELINSALERNNIPMQNLNQK